MDKVRSLLIAPNADNPMNIQAATDFKNGTWEQKAKQWTNTYAR